jgi:hypothetical protein
MEGNMTNRNLINPKPAGAAEAARVENKSAWWRSARRQSFKQRTVHGSAIPARSRALSTVLVGALAMLGAGGSLQAQTIGPLSYHGGPVLSSFTIYPLYYGNWGDTTSQQTYLKGLAAYISGHNAPAGQQPMTRQYGVYSVNVAEPATASVIPGVCKSYQCTKPDVRNIIETYQTNKKLPGYGPNTLIVVFLASGFVVTDNSGGAYHSSESTSAFWAVVPKDAGLGSPVAGPRPAAPGPLQLVTSHEVFEAAANPADDDVRGWDEAVDGCPDGMAQYGGSWINLSFGWIAGVHDNTQAGACSTTGYTSLSEYQDYGVTYAQFRAHYDQLWPQGWRLHILNAYVSNGQVLYNAVWRPAGDTGEIQLLGATYADYRAKYAQLWAQNWRLNILQSYVLNGQVYYNAVWRPGNGGEIQDYGVTYAQYRSHYDQYWQEDWRLYILQSYVVNGKVLYNAVWKPGSSGEIQAYGCTYWQYRSQYDQLWPQGWRLYILDAYVANNQVLYNAVWRPGDEGEIQVYGRPYEDYRQQYDTLWTEGWRLYSLESYVVNRQVLYNAVWRPGTVDRPL